MMYLMMYLMNVHMYTNHWSFTFKKKKLKIKCFTAKSTEIIMIKNKDHNIINCFIFFKCCFA